MSTAPLQNVIDADDDGIRLDRWFKRHRPDVPHALLRVDRVVDRKDGPARIAKNRVDALVGKRAEYDLGARQGVGRLGVRLAVPVHLRRSSVCGPCLSPGEKEKGPLGPFGVRLAVRSRVLYRAGGEPITSTRATRRSDMGYSPKFTMEKANTVSSAQRQSGSWGKI